MCVYFSTACLLSTFTPPGGGGGGGAVVEGRVRQYGWYSFPPYCFRTNRVWGLFTTPAKLPGLPAIHEGSHAVYRNIKWYQTLP